MSEDKKGICSVCQSEGPVLPHTPTEDEGDQFDDIAWYVMDEHSIAGTGMRCEEGIGTTPQALVKG